MGDDEETVQHAEGGSWNSEEVHGRDDLAVVAQEGQPPSLGNSGFRVARRTQRETVRSEITNPSICSSPWMRGAPQVGLSATI